MELCVYSYFPILCFLQTLLIDSTFVYGFNELEDGGVWFGIAEDGIEG